jgi:predicted GIY-YIG superfamily endonuclease
MQYVYLLRSISHPGERYFGITSNLRQRIADHNTGRSPHTAKFRPWRVETYIGFSDERRAVAFERYLKTGSGKAFSKKRL